jgi:hypothetical protein
VGGPPTAPALKGSGKVVFNLAKGRPESASLELEGDFRDASSRLPGDSAHAAGADARPLQMREKVDLTFSD